MLSGRRLKFAIVILVSQLLLLALAIAWIIQMSLILQHGAVYFVEKNHLVLYLEIIANVIIMLFAATVFALQLTRLKEKRSSDR